MGFWAKVRIFYNECLKTEQIVKFNHNPKEKRPSQSQ